MRVNTAATRNRGRTHQGAPARAINPLAELRRSVLSCFLWENEFYEDGTAIAERIRMLVHQCKPNDVIELALEARSDMHLRHVPLLLLRELLRHPERGDARIAAAIAQTIQRPDEMMELIAIYGDGPLPRQMRLGLGWALRKFDEYQLAKYNRRTKVRLEHVIRLCHPKPQNAEQADLWKRVLDDKLRTPDTWETRLSAGEDKNQSFTELLKERKLGYMALLRNLRNMVQSGVDKKLIRSALVDGAPRSRVLPFRYISAANAVPELEPAIDAAMRQSVAAMRTLPGKTVVLVDVSYSMFGYKLSEKSDLNRFDGAAALAILVAGIAEELRVFSFSTDVVEVPPRQGMALRDALLRSQPNNSTYLGRAVAYIDAKAAGYDRLIVITDEQSHDKVPDPRGRGYMINVASAQRGVGYGPWIHIDGFSENVVRFIQELES